MSGGSVNKLDGSYTKLFTGQYSRYVSKWKAFISLFNSNVKPVHIGFPELPQLEKAGFVEDYGFSFFTMFLNSNERFQEALRTVEDAGIRTCSLNMVGLPRESRKMIMETFEVNRQVRPTHSDFGCFFPFSISWAVSLRGRF